MRIIYWSYIINKIGYLFYYSVQLKAPWFHSWYSPNKRIIIKIRLLKVQERILQVLKIKIIGRISAISTSKIKKIIAIKKNRIEKGIREEFKGSNPHSKGEVFSRSVIIFLDKIEARSITIVTIIKIIMDIINKLVIIHINKN